MTFTIDATWQNGVLKPKQPVSLPDGAEVRVSITLPGEQTDPLANVIGISDGPVAGDVADNHDRYLHGSRRD
jgi:predicted DNA-binding antitoxin AbrB/MazE fold protein